MGGWAGDCARWAKRKRAHHFDLHWLTTHELGLRCSTTNRHAREGGHPVRRVFSIHHQRPWDTGSSAFADDDSRATIFKQSQLRILAARCVRVLPGKFCPMNQRRRECRALDAPAALRAKNKKHTSIFTTVTSGSPDIPRAMVSGLYVFSPASPALLPPSPTGITANLTPA